MSLWDTLPLHIADNIKQKAMELHFKPLCDELKTFHKQRVRTYKTSRTGVELECDKNTVSVWGHTLDVPRKGGTYPHRGILIHYDLAFLKRDNYGRSRCYGNGARGLQWCRKKDTKQALVAHIMQFVPDYETLRKRKKIPKLGKCTIKQLMHLLIVSD